MEGLSPQILLLRESQKEDEFCLNAASNPFGVWLNVNSNIEQMDSDNLQDDKHHKRQCPSWSSNKVTSPNYRRFPPYLYRTKSLSNLDIKFEHFGDSELYIEQYRRAKQLKIEERLSRLMQRKERAISGEKVTNFVDKNTQSSTVLATEQNNVCPKQRGLQSPIVGLCGEIVKPSLPQSGYFAGRKWVYPKDFARVCSKHIKVKSGDSRTQPKRSDKQVLNASRAMFLQGTGKPLYTSFNKKWAVSSHRTACKSAPTGRQNLPKQKGMWNSTQASHIKSRSQSDSLTCADLSALLEKHCLNQPKQRSLRTMPVHQSYEHVKRVSRSLGSGSKSVHADNVEYEKIFRNVFDFYDHKPDKESRVYINIAS